MASAAVVDLGLSDGGAAAAAAGGDGDDLAAEVDASDLLLEEAIGAGQFGTVYRGTLRSLGLAVAVKCLFEGAAGAPIPADERKFLVREVAALRAAAHPNIVAFVGVARQSGPLPLAGGGGALGTSSSSSATTGTGGGGGEQQQQQQQRLFLVTEFVDGVTLERALLGDADGGVSGGDPAELALVTRVALLLDVAQAMMYLHSRSVLFRDLKPENVMVDQSRARHLADPASLAARRQWRAKLCDFGFARLHESVHAKHLTLCGTDDFMAPEVILGLDYHQPADVYGFGLVALEALTLRSLGGLQRLPQNAFAFDDADLMARRDECATGAFSKHAADGEDGARMANVLFGIAEDCCSYEPEDRPEFTDVVERLAALHKALGGGGAHGGMDGSASPTMSSSSGPEPRAASVMLRQVASSPRHKSVHVGSRASLLQGSVQEVCAKARRDLDAHVALLNPRITDPDSARAHSSVIHAVTQLHKSLQTAEVFTWPSALTVEPSAIADGQRLAFPPHGLCTDPTVLRLRSTLSGVYIAVAARVESLARTASQPKRDDETDNDALKRIVECARTAKNVRDSCNGVTRALADR